MESGRRKGGEAIHRVPSWTFVGDVVGVGIVPDLGATDQDRPSLRQDMPEETLGNGIMKPLHPSM
jgi:hypothetical protein